MEDFSGKEKAAMLIFGVILLAMILQIVTRSDLFFASRKDIIPLAWREPDLTANLLSRPRVTLSVSSRNQPHQTPERLLDGDPNSYWHVDLDLVGEPAWVTVDFGEGREPAVRALAALPREDIPRQFFRTARLQVSDDGETWENLAGIPARETPSRATWRRWEFENDRTFRYYRLLITDGHEGGRFYSMAGLALFE